MDTLSATLLLLTIMDPPGNVANFISGLRAAPPERRIGMRLVMVAVQMFLNGLKPCLKSQRRYAFA